MPKLFTKSAFKIATHCPMQAYYYYNSGTNEGQYENQSANDGFLKSLAEGGFQVGELAKIYCDVPPKNDLEGCSGYDEPLKRTRELFKQEKVNIAEAAFRYGDCFVRADVVKKDGHRIELIEVKAKSWDSKDSERVFAKEDANGKLTINSKILDYLYDVAFQKWVVENALKTDCPDEVWEVQAFLMMPDKSVINTVPRLNGLFRVKKNGDRAYAEPIPGAREIVKAHKEILHKFPVDKECNSIIAGETCEQEKILGKKFIPFIEEKSKWYVNNEKHYCSLGSKCFKCPFTLSKEGCDKGLESGYEECWRNVANFKDYDFKKSSIKELWGSYLGDKKNTWVQSGKYFLSDITKSDLSEQAKTRPASGWDHCERKWLQIRNTISGATDPVILKDKLSAEMNSWNPPFHMIDFETTASALPFFENIRPYEQIAFQFSHHIIHEDGRIEHAGQFLKTQPGKFPNFDFIKELKKQLGKDGGTIFRYATHENSILRAIRQQLLNSEESEKDELVAFIESITHPTSEEADTYKKAGISVEPGTRDMIDLCDIVKRFYWHPDMKGSNSIKQVLPAILKSGTYIQEKYSKPIYGSEIKSCNYTADNPIALVQKDVTTGEILNPYKILPQLKDVQRDLLEELTKLGPWTKDELTRYVQNTSAEEMGADEDTRINNGGLPLVLFRSFQALNPDGDWEKELAAFNLNYNALRKCLLKYCELDSMAMVLVCEYFAYECGLLKR